MSSCTMPYFNCLALPCLALLRLTYVTWVNWADWPYLVLLLVCCMKLILHRLALHFSHCCNSVLTLPSCYHLIIFSVPYIVSTLSSS
ncbi:hypothetical protein QR685DRAFT_533185 [Neurospora intermedia]|uniref:Uncharacterized protein n=1 Tax=Neurospora intermedia TaxID=5142 RepID=A0ABR3D7P1_NEUIN